MKNRIKIGLFSVCLGLLSIGLTSCGDESSCMECGAFGVSETFCAGESYNGVTLTEENIQATVDASGGICTLK